MTVSIVTPINNEAEILVKNAAIIAAYLDQQEIGFEHILVENGSRDRTRSLAGAVAANDTRVRVLELPYRSLGESMRVGFLAARHECVICYPIDLAVALDFIPEALAEMQHCDAVIGSKSHPKSDVKRPLARTIASMVFGFLANALLDEQVPDTQCVKAFRRDLLQSVVPGVWNNDITFELALYYHAVKKGYRLIEYPVVVDDRRRDSKIRPHDFLSTPPRLMLLAWQLRRRLSHQRRSSTVRAPD